MGAPLNPFSARTSSSTADAWRGLRFVVEAVSNAELQSTMATESSLARQCNGELSTGPWIICIDGEWRKESREVRIRAESGETMFRPRCSRRHPSLRRKASETLLSCTRDDDHILPKPSPSLQFPLTALHTRLPSKSLSVVLLRSAVAMASSSAPPTQML